MSRPSSRPRHGRPSSSRSPPATSAWRMARPLSVRSGSMASMPSRSCAHGAADRPPVRIARTSAGAMPAWSASSRRIRVRRPRDERLIAEDRAGLHGAHRVAPDRPVRCPQLDPRQLGGPGRQRLEPELEPRRDGAADVGAVGGDAVERRGGPEVDDDRRRAVQPACRERVHQPVGADLAGSLGPDGERHGAGERPASAAARGGRRSSRRAPSGRARPRRTRSRRRRRTTHRRGGAARRAAPRARRRWRAAPSQRDASRRARRSAAARP